MQCREVTGRYSADVRATSHYFKREFRLSYQPVVSLESYSLHSLEAFVCWQPDRAKLYSSNFHALISQSQLETSFHHWLFYEASQQMHLWQVNCLADIPLLISIKLSVAQLFCPYLIEFIAQALDEIGLTPAHLQLVIPAQWMVENLQAAKSFVIRLRRIGVSICVDDFEPSEVFANHLYHLPIDTLKVDAIDTSQEAATPASDAGVQRAIAIAHENHIQVISKGIETDAQLLSANTLGCAYGQGYLLAQPLSARQATLLVATHVEQHQEELLLYLTAMNALSQFAQRLLGRILVAKYWQETKPNIPWLALIEPYKDQNLIVESVRCLKLDMRQQQDLLHWTHQFVQRCNHIIRGFSQLLAQADIDLPTKQLLKVQMLQKAFPKVLAVR